jgi:hypothetical protein
MMLDQGGLGNEGVVRNEEGKETSREGNVNKLSS